MWTRWPCNRPGKSAGWQTVQKGLPPSGPLRLRDELGGHPALDAVLRADVLPLVAIGSLGRANLRDLVALREFGEDLGPGRGVAAQVDVIAASVGDGVGNCRRCGTRCGARRGARARRRRGGP